MEASKQQLKFLRGTEPSEDLLRDIETIKSFNSNKITEILDKVFEWLTKIDIENEFEKWTNSLNEKEKEKLGRVINFIMIFSQESVRRNFSNGDIKKDLQKLGLSDFFVDKLIVKINDNRKKITTLLEKNEVFTKNVFIGADWSIEHIMSTSLIKESKKIKITLTIAYGDPKDGEEKREIIEFDLDRFNSFIEILNECKESAKKWEYSLKKKEG